MSVRIAVLDPLPVYRRGLIATLGEAGLVVDAPEDLLAWSRQDAQQVVFLTLQSPEDWQLMTELCQSGSNPIVVAVLTNASVPDYLEALSGGAATAIPRDAPPELLRQVFERAVHGMSLLPVDVIRALAHSHEPSERAREAPTDRELSWLRDLARGTTVTRLADQSGYSERTMYRLLQDLYRRMGVSKRTEALIHAHKQGWL